MKTITIKKYDYEFTDLECELMLAVTVGNDLSEVLHRVNRTLKKALPFELVELSSNNYTLINDTVAHHYMTNRREK